MYIYNNKIFDNFGQSAARIESLCEAYVNGCHKLEVIQCGQAMVLCYTLFEYWLIGRVLSHVNSHFSCFLV